MLRQIEPYHVTGRGDLILRAALNVASRTSFPDTLYVALSELDLSA